MSDTKTTSSPRLPVDANRVAFDVGARCVYVGDDDEYRGRHVWVRRITSGGNLPIGDILVDDGDEADTDIRESDSWRWSAWVYSHELSVVAARRAEGGVK
jgi:hypothetical protein